MFESEKKLERSKRPHTKILLIGAAVIIVVLAAVAGYFIWRTISLSSNPSAAGEQKSTDITQKVGKIFAVPTEKPTIAQISDRDKLNDQPFFAKAQNGDYLLVFPTEKTALIYREHENKIINAGPINAPAPAQ